MGTNVDPVEFAEAQREGDIKRAIEAKQEEIAVENYLDDAYDRAKDAKLDEQCEKADEKLNQAIESMQDRTQYLVKQTLKPNSIELGKAGHRVKLYFDDAKDLELQLKELKELGLWENEIQEND